MASYEWPPVSSLSGRFWEKVVDTGGTDACWLWTAFINPSGYGMVRNGAWMALAHRVSWTLANGRVPDGAQVLHHCDTRACVNPSHLYVGTNADNIADKVARGRSSWPRPERRGEGHPLVKLTEKEVALIRKEPYEHGSGRRLARELGVSPALITRIRKGQLWTHV
jgi:hypothetical protein